MFFQVDGDLSVNKLIFLFYFALAKQQKSVDLNDDKKLDFKEVIL